ncbi:hypothetical protein FOA52_014312 [Chlamydomonas sp. UWO 241]|nr:hypothetical protein FOA52_014312 [Chlamydomonas sp. UWO 241]
MATTDPWSTSFTWRIDHFSKLPSGDPVRSDCFEAGTCTWRLRAHPNGSSAAQGTHLSVYLEVQDAMWEPSATYKFTVVNQHDTGSSTSKFNREIPCWGRRKLIELPALRDVAAGWLVDDKLVLRVDVTVKHEDRFKLDAGVPCDVALKLPCGVEVPAVGLFLQAASPFFRAALEDVKGSALIPVDGSFGAWAYILMDLYPLHDPPALTWGSVYTLLPVAHKYNFTKLLARLMAFVKDNSKALTHNLMFNRRYVIRWLALAERLQMDELRKQVLGKVRSMTKEELQKAFFVQVSSGAKKRNAIRKAMEELSQELRDELLTTAAFAAGH